jgi:hypothetical protein
MNRPRLIVFATIFLLLIFRGLLTILSAQEGLAAGISMASSATDTIADVQPYKLHYLSHDITLGWNTLYNEYLSPLYYRGNMLSYRFSMEIPITQSHPEWLVMQQTNVGYGLFLNPARTGATRHIAFRTLWGFVHQWQLPWGIVIGAGPGAIIEGATSYNSRNQNNPADQQLNGDLMAQSLVAYRLRVRRFVADLRLHLACALVGVGFAPYYNESYLQAYYYDNLLNHFAPHSFGRRHFYHIGVSLDLPIWRITTLRLTYNYTTSARRINFIYRGSSWHEFGVGFATYLRSFNGYQEIHDPAHTTAISL